jgi:hypothetical protein
MSAAVSAESKTGKRELVSWRPRRPLHSWDKAGFCPTLFSRGTWRANSYAIPRRLNAGSLAESAANAKTAADTSVAPTANTGKGLMAIPQIASVEAIDTSATDDTISDRLGRAGPMCSRSRLV